MSRSADAPAAPRWLQGLLCLDDFEAEARRHLPRPVFGYVAGAAETNQSLRANRASFQAWEMVPRVLVDITPRDTGVELFGQRYAAPFGVAPMGLAALSAYRGDLVIAQAAQRENIPFVLSGSSLIRLEEVIAVNPGAWFQAYLPGDDAGILALLERVKTAGYRTLVITLDTPAAANRESNLRAGFTIPVRPGPALAWQGLTHPRWLFGTFLRTLLRHGMPHFENSYATRGAPILSPHVERNLSDRGHLNWRHLQMIRRVWGGELVVKGVLDARDARRAADEGVDGVIVSNHGGRQLDGAAAPLAVLPRIVEACPGIPVMLDSGVRRGSDVLKALALGARFVFVGRPFAFAAAVAGEAGAHRAIDLLRSEVSRNMALMGVLRPEDLDPSHLIPAQRN
ncbi:MAG: alpha-hydroxy-acid oxidizing protein [Comamonadaceae bacterium]|jgi:L-lactate dehydrogenase (cytochrome)|uniref:Alpha-hydroxy-acid oxidizing protein n=1 Tax=Hydrogenophaga borbori TaxID=2294117 RepID=A0A372EHQ4_9BURK|nr:MULTISPECIES: alpha-hydroxy acid oxidase [Hydrogenophaga]NCT97766.1 alpha-hydroxy-acid oxidizing protein [Comamonadaceae bacterium]RFP77987.1 alpha-hydroxy-acid oxidizing protein [Hydrogenophaga borbori]WQB83026.1 alpha-hydroxy acid oxidase [Hydrogenophaga sp. SNF1]